MKNLLIIRHAKSSWDNPDLTDFERPLNQRGIEDAKLMSSVLKHHNLKFEKIFCSTANRAKMTIEIFEKESAIEKNIIQYVDELYNASRKDLLNFLKQINNSLTSIGIVGHNPGLTDLTHYLLDDFDSELPTCSLVLIELTIDNWSELHSGMGQLKFFEYPKKYKF
ncbi:MAG: histidine phosphatase family protein [Ignavibacteria bacterium]|nr:histidine phosphatase family protein [Ignavibacteria bacterium]